MPRSNAGQPDDPANGQTGRGAWTTGWQRLSQTFLRPPSGTTGKPPATGEAVDYARLTDDEKRSRIVALSPVERRVGFAAAALAAVLALLTTVPYMVKRTVVTAQTVTPSHGRCPVGFTYVTHGSAAATCRGVLPTSTYLEHLALYLGLALAILVTVLIRRRSAVAFATALTGVALGSVLYLVPYVGVAAWIFLRGYRTQKYGEPNVKSPMPGYVPPVGRGTTRRAKPAAAGGGRRGGGRGPASSAPAARKPPEASKRYTPKTPPKPAKKGAAARGNPRSAR